MAERHVAEEALRKAEKLAVAARLAASFSHEINNPLESVTNLLYLVGGSSSLNESRKYAEIAARELARVSEMVTQNLRFHKESINPVTVRDHPGRECRSQSLSGEAGRCGNLD